MSMMLAALLVSVSPSIAAERTVTALSSFSPFGPEGPESFAHPTGVAVDQATGEVFVADGAPNNVVDIFGSEGGDRVGLIAGTGSESFAFAGEPTGLAVDNDPASSSYQDLYVSDVTHNVVDRFKRLGPHDYEYECQFNGWYGTGGEGCHISGGLPVEHFIEPLGVAVDEDGDVYIASFEPSGGAVDEFDSSGHGVIQATEAQHSVLRGHPEYLDVNASGDIFVSPYFIKYLAVLDRHSLVGPVESEGELLGGSSAYAIALDHSKGSLYVDRASEVFRYGPLSSGGLLEEERFSNGTLGGSEGIAVDSADGVIYISSIGHNSVYAYAPKKILLPNVKTCSASQLTSNSATLNGEVNPLETAEASYALEYGVTPYEQQVGGAISGNVFKPVSAEISGLTPGTEYHCRLSATTTEATAFGVVEDSPDSTFETPPLLPQVDEETPSATEVTFNGAILNGLVNTGNGETTYHFAYGVEAGNYTVALPGITIGKSAAQTPVEQAVPTGTLDPGTTYHFALIASNKSGTIVGPDETFSTPSAGTRGAPPVAVTGAAQSISPTGATLTGRVVPNGLPTWYEFEFGTTGAFGTTLYGGAVNLEDLQNGEATATQALANLQPGVTYHYRLIAFSAAGNSTGAEGTFTTPSQSLPLAQPITLPIIPTPPFPVVKNPKHKPTPKKHHHGRAKPKPKHAKTKHAKKAKARRR